MEEEARVLMERVDQQEPQEPEQIGWGRDNCCFACASIFIVASMVTGILLACSITKESNIAISALSMAACLIILITSLCWAVYYAKKGYTPRAIRPADIPRLRPQGEEIPSRFTVRVSRRTQGRDVDVEDPSRSQPPEAHTSSEHSSPNLGSGEEARRILKATVSSAIQKITESACRRSPRLHAASSRAERGHDIDVEKASTAHLSDPAVSGPSCLQPQESRAPQESHAPGEHSFRNVESGERETLQSEGQSILQASADEQPGSGGSVSAEPEVVQSDISAIRQRKFTPELGESSSDD